MNVHFFERKQNNSGISLQVAYCDKSVHANLIRLNHHVNEFLVPRPISPLSHEQYDVFHASDYYKSQCFFKHGSIDVKIWDLNANKHIVFHVSP